MAQLERSDSASDFEPNAATKTAASNHDAPPKCRALFATFEGKSITSASPVSRACTEVRDARTELMPAPSTVEAASERHAEFDLPQLMLDASRTEIGIEHVQGDVPSARLQRTP
jgi:hypothetical protein